MYAKAAWKQVIKQIKISSFSALALIKGFDKTWELGTSFVGNTIYTLSGIGNNNVGRAFSFL